MALGYRPEIDGLRAVAVIPVILFHAGFASFSGGFVGVDVFFVISGYLIGRILLTEIGEGRFSLVRFYERRIRRIVPALALVTAATIPFAWVWLVPNDMLDFARSIVGVVTFSSNVYFYLQANYFAPSAEYLPLLHTWSLAVEEQFYIVVPLLLMLLVPRGRGWTWIVIGGLSLVSFGAALYFSVIAKSFNFFLLPTRFWELGVGLLAALWLERAAPVPGWLRQAGPAFGLAMIAAAVVLFDKSTPFPAEPTLLPVLGTALIILCSDGRDATGRLLSLRPMVAIGLVSYSAYLWHYPLFAMARIRLGEPEIWVFWALIGLTFVLAALTWRFVEQPARNARLVPRPAVFTGAAVAGAALLAFGLAGHAERGFLDRKDGIARDFGRHLRETASLSRACVGDQTFRPSCQTHPEPELAVWGDSFAMHHVAGLVAANPGLRVTQLTLPLCAPALSLQPLRSTALRDLAAAEACLDFNGRVFDTVRATPSLRHVLVSSPYNWTGGGTYLTLDGPATLGPEEVARRLIADLDRFAEAGLVPLLVSPPPRNGQNIFRCVTNALWHGDDVGMCDVDAEASRRFAGDAFETLTRIAAAYPVIFLDAFMCEEGRCPVYRDGTILYRDGGHLSRDGSALVWRRIDFRDYVARIARTR
ncbi:MAG: acyltransferase family protein [Paracoccaceae bacterium]